MYLCYNLKNFKKDSRNRKKKIDGRKQVLSHESMAHVSIIKDCIGPKEEFKPN